MNEVRRVLTVWVSEGLGVRRIGCPENRSEKVLEICDEPKGCP